MTYIMVPDFTVAYWCVLVAALMPIACRWLAKWGMFGKPRKRRRLRQPRSARLAGAPEGLARARQCRPGQQL
jgi:uncharacterized MAPEG superfamily protein